MRYGAVLPQGEVTGEYLEGLRAFAAALEDASYDHLIVYDHVLGSDRRIRPPNAGPYDHRSAFFEALTVLAYLAGTTSLDLATGVLVLPQRQTALVAKQASTVDLLSGGRLRLGVGIGWNEVEYSALGIPFQTRADRLEEQVTLLRRYWTEDVVTAAGVFESVESAGVFPPPVQRPIPLWIGAFAGRRPLTRVGRLADGWMPPPMLQPGKGFEEAWDVISAAALDAGRDPRALGVEGHVRAGDKGRVRGRVARWREVGVEWVVVNPLGQGLEWPNGFVDALRRSAEGFA
jgi:probable F420-dependent oxidoreductase